MCHVPYKQTHTYVGPVVREATTPSAYQRGVGGVFLAQKKVGAEAPTELDFDTAVVFSIDYQHFLVWLAMRLLIRPRCNPIQHVLV